MDKKKRRIFIYILLAFVLTYIISIALKNTTFSFYINNSAKNDKTIVIPDDYKLNADLSKCASGSITWDEKKDSVLYSSTNPSKCNIYLEQDDSVVYYSTLEEAVNDIGTKTIHGKDTYFDEATISVNPLLNKIKLLKDITIKESITILEDIYLNLNGHTLNFSNNSKESFIYITDNHNLSIYGRKKGSTIYYKSDTNIPMFSMSNNSTLNISVSTFNVIYDGKSVYSILNNIANKTSTINIDRTNILIEGANISFIYSDKPLDVNISNSNISVEAKENATIINLLKMDTRANIANTSILYKEESESSNSGNIFNIPNGPLSLKSSNITIESKSIKSNPLVVTDMIDINASDIFTKLNSESAIIEVNNKGTINALNLTATGTKPYIGISYIGKEKLFISNSMFDLKEKNIPVLYYEGNVILENTDVVVTQG